MAGTVAHRSRVASTLDRMAASSEISTEVLVVGGGPAGAAAGYWLSQLGHDCIVLEKSRTRGKKLAVTDSLRVQ